MTADRAKCSRTGFYTAWVFKFLRLISIYVIVWTNAPNMNSAQFVALYTALGSLGSALQNVAEDILDILVSTSKLQEVAKLLNQSTGELRRAKQQRDLPHQAHASVSGALDATIRRWEANANDAQATTSLIAQTRALKAFALTEAEAAKAAEATSDRGSSMRSNFSLSTSRGSQDGEIDEQVSVRRAAEVIGELSDLMTCWASLLDMDSVDDGGTMLIFDVHYTLPQHAVGKIEEGAPMASPIFTGLCITDHTSGAMAAQIKASGDNARLRTPIRLPSGVIVGMRVTSQDCGFQTDSDPRASFALIQMLCGFVRPQRGIARTIVKVFLVDAKPTFKKGNLFSNLISFAACPLTGHLPALIDVWRLCHRVGMSASIIGRTPDAVHGWEQRMLSEHTIPYDDQVRVSLVRALFARPEALVLYRIAEGWTPSRQRRLTRVMREYLDGSLADLTSRHVECQRCLSRQTRSSVVYCGCDGLLQQILTPTDVVLSIHNHREGTLRKAAEVFGDELKGELSDIDETSELVQHLSADTIQVVEAAASIGIIEVKDVVMRSSVRGESPLALKARVSTS